MSIFKYFANLLNQNQGAIAEAHGASLTLSDAHPGLLAEIYFPQRTST